MKNEKVLKLSENQLGEVTGGGKVGCFVSGNVSGFFSGPLGIVGGISAVSHSDEAAESVNKMVKGITGKNPNLTSGEIKACGAGTIVGGVESTALVVGVGAFAVGFIARKIYKKNKSKYLLFGLRSVRWPI